MPATTVSKQYVGTNLFLKVTIEKRENTPEKILNKFTDLKIKYSRSSDLM